MLTEADAGRSDTHTWLIWPKARLAQPQSTQNSGSNPWLETPPGALPKTRRSCSELSLSNHQPSRPGRWVDNFLSYQKESGNRGVSKQQKILQHKKFESIQGANLKLRPCETSRHPSRTDCRDLCLCNAAAFSQFNCKR